MTDLFNQNSLNGRVMKFASAFLKFIAGRMRKDSSFIPKPQHIYRYVGAFIIILYATRAIAGDGNPRDDVKATMLNATRFMVEKVSVNGGYVRLYLPDLSRRWGELELYKTQVQVQDPGITSMGNLFLDAYAATKDEYYYQAAEKAAEGLILGQLECGGWNYFIDYAGDRSIKQWYNTIGKNAWGFEEYYHYYGNATFDDLTTSDAAKFLLRIYFEKLDSKFKPALDKAIGFILEAQYPLGGWPQRFPLKYDYPHGYETDYTSFYTFNDDATWGNLEFLVLCYATLGQERFLDPIIRGMNFYLITQQGNPQAGWGLQYNMHIEPDHARSFEPASLNTSQTRDHILKLLKFYQLTGDRKFLSRIPDAIKWLESTLLPVDMTNNGARTHPLFVELGTNRALWAHRLGTGVNNQRYWIDYNTENLYSYGDNTKIDINQLKQLYDTIQLLDPKELTKNSPIKAAPFNLSDSPQKYYLNNWTLDVDFNQTFKRVNSNKSPDKAEITSIINSLDNQHRWLSKHEWVSKPYTISEDGIESNTAMLADEIHANWIVDSSEQEYISTQVYIKNMRKLIAYLKQNAL